MCHCISVAHPIVSRVCSRFADSCGSSPVPPPPPENVDRWVEIRVAERNRGKISSEGSMTLFFSKQQKMLQKAAPKALRKNVNENNR